MLSCRFRGPNRPQYQRRLSSADCVVDLLTDDKFERLPSLPLVPYAMALATTNIFRAFRDGRRDNNTTQRDIESCRATLGAMRAKWTSARSMTRPVARAYCNISQAQKDPITTGSAGEQPIEPAGLNDDCLNLGKWFTSNLDPLPDDWSLLFDDAYLPVEAMQESARFLRFYDDVSQENPQTEQASQST